MRRHRRRCIAKQRRGVRQFLRTRRQRGVERQRQVGERLGGASPERQRGQRRLQHLARRRHRLCGLRPVRVEPPLGLRRLDRRPQRLGGRGIGQARQPFRRLRRLRARGLRILARLRLPRGEALMRADHPVRGVALQRIGNARRDRRRVVIEAQAARGLGDRSALLRGLDPSLLPVPRGGGDAVAVGGERVDGVRLNEQRIIDHQRRQRRLQRGGAFPLAGEVVRGPFALRQGIQALCLGIGRQGGDGAERGPCCLRPRDRRPRRRRRADAGEAGAFGMQRRRLVRAFRPGFEKPRVLVLRMAVGVGLHRTLVQIRPRRLECIQRRVQRAPAASVTRQPARLVAEPLGERAEAGEPGVRLQDALAGLALAFQDRRPTAPQFRAVQAEHAEEPLARDAAEIGGDRALRQRLVGRVAQVALAALAAEERLLPPVIRAQPDAHAQFARLVPERELGAMREAEQRIADRGERGRFAGLVRAQHDMQPPLGGKVECHVGEVAVAGENEARQFHAAPPPASRCATTCHASGASARSAASVSGRSGGARPGRCGTWLARLCSSASRSCNRSGSSRAA